MSCGRVIGNELRDVPPECLPIWGQRWSGYRAPRGPSPFSTRIFSVDRMSEMGPVLTSPTQFEATLTEEDEGEDTSSESGRLYSTFPSSPLTIRLDATELTSRPETPTPRSVHCSSNHPYGGPDILHRSGRHPLPPNSAYFGTTLLQRQRSGQSGIQRYASEPLLHPPALRHGISIQGGYGSFENDYSLWDMDRTLAGIQPQADPSYRSHVPSGQPRRAMPLHSVPEWQFANAHTQSSAYLIATPPPLPSHCFTIPSSQQNVGIDSSWNPESSMAMIPNVAHSRNPMISQWSSGSTPPNLSSLGPLQNSGSSLGPGVVCHPVSDYPRSRPHPEDLFGTFAHAEGCTLLSLDKPGGD